jgi:F-type H+-transporting ATPase subunit alpha
LSYALGGGSCTCFPVIETLAGDVSAYISTNCISITDGQIFLSTDLFLSGIKPAIDVGLSVTRVGSAPQSGQMKLVEGTYKLDLAQYNELQAFSQFTADLGEETKSRLATGRRLVEVFPQVNNEPVQLSSQLLILSLAQQNVLAQLELDQIQPFLDLLKSLPSWVFLST